MIISSDNAARERTGLFAGVFGILTNLLAFIIKIAAGTLTGSVTIAADAVNSFTDAGSSVLTLIGFKLASKPADREHPYGHARYEDITAVFISIIMLLVGILFAKSSIEKIITPSELAIGTVTYVSLVLAILLKTAQAAVNRRLAKKINSIALRAAAEDSRNDAVITLSVLLSMTVMQIFRINIDGWAGLLVSLFIIRSSALTLKSAVSPMLGSPPSEELIREVEKIIKSRPDVLGYHDLVIHNYGSGHNFGSVHCEVDGDRRIKEVHDILDGIEKEILERLGVVITIHTDPVEAEKNQGTEDKDGN